MSSQPTDYEKIWEIKWGEMQTYGPIHRHHRRLLRKMTKGIEFRSLLDVGCGAGQNIGYIKRFHKPDKVVGIDISDEALVIAKKNLGENVTLLKKDILLGELADKFDLIISFDVIEHIVEDQDFLDAISKMSNGYLILSTLQGRMRRFENSIGHIRNYKHGELQEKLMKSGFVIDKTIEWGFPLYSPLYRNILDNDASQRVTSGTFGFFKKILCHFLYLVFHLNSSRKGDIIVVRAKKASSTPN